MNTNLDVTSLNDGTKLIWAQSKEDWDSCYIKNIPAYCYHDKDTSKENGLLYNIHALRSEKLAPKGCTIPTEIDVETMIKSFGTFQLSASLLLKSKEPNTWTKPGLDLFNMNIKPYGVRLGEDRYFGEKVYFYCETTNKESLVFYVISDSADKINLLKRNISIDNVYYGLYVRCIKNK
jgi:uncharacterized protein (TIGR02145 family)